MQLETVGVRGMIEQLLAGLDHTFIRTKLWLAAVCGVGVCLVGVLAARFVGTLDWWADGLLWSGLGLILLWAVSACFALITQMTVLEISHLRAAQWGEAVRGMGRHTRCLMCVYLVAGGGVAALLILFRWLPTWLVQQPDLDLAGGALAAVLLIVGLVLEVILWPTLGLLLLLAPIVVVEECSAGQALQQWWRLLREHLGRILLYEALAAALAGVAALPFAFPVALASWGLPPLTELLETVAGVTLGVLGGLALTPLIAYLVVANVPEPALRAHHAAITPALRRKRTLRRLRRSATPQAADTSYNNSLTGSRSSRMYMGLPLPLGNVWDGSMPTAR
jgi:hypothetical protein